MRWSADLKSARVVCMRPAPLELPQWRSVPAAGKNFHTAPVDTHVETVVPHVGNGVSDTGKAKFQPFLPALRLVSRLQSTGASLGCPRRVSVLECVRRGHGSLRFGYAWRHQPLRVGRKIGGRKRRTLDSVLIHLPPQKKPCLSSRLNAPSTANASRALSVNRPYYNSSILLFPPHSPPCPNLPPENIRNPSTPSDIVPAIAPVILRIKPALLHR